MRWRSYVVDETLIVEGKFNAISSGLLGGWREVDFLFNHTVRDFDFENPVDYLKQVAEKYEMKDFFGLLTSVPMDKLAIERFEDVTVFVTAGVKNPNEKIEAKIGTINIIVVLDGKISDGGMVNAVITATEAKAKSLIEQGFNFTGTTTDAVIIATTNVGKYYEYAGPISTLGKKIWISVGKAVKKSLSKWDF